MAFALLSGPRLTSANGDDDRRMLCFSFATPSHGSARRKKRSMFVHSRTATTNALSSSAASPDAEADAVSDNNVSAGFFVTYHEVTPKKRMRSTSTATATLHK
jgi:hypothetical protein